MREVKESAFDIFDREDADFKLLLNTCDNDFWELRVYGVGAEAIATQVLTRDDEEKLWATGVMSPHTPKGLLKLHVAWRCRTSQSTSEECLTSRSCEVYLHVHRKCFEKSIQRI